MPSSGLLCLTWAQNFVHAAVVVIFGGVVDCVFDEAGREKLFTRFITALDAIFDVSLACIELLLGLGYNILDSL